jgi:hypothetical protein
LGWWPSLADGGFLPPVKDEYENLSKKALDTSTKKPLRLI